MVSKELRELLPVAAFAVVVYVWLGFGQPASPPWPLQVLPIWGRAEDFPFLSGEFLGSFAVVSGVFAVALGLRQTVSESARGTWLFLLHRPLGRATEKGTSLIVGYFRFSAGAVLSSSISVMFPFPCFRVASGAAVPEPSTLIVWSLLGASGIGLGWWRRRREAA
jgi:hypothetical protein